MSRERVYKLREDLVIRRRVFAGEVKYVVKDPLRLEYYTIDELSLTLLNLCDGRRDLAALTETAQAMLPHMGLDVMTLLNFYEGYRKAHFFDDAWEENILLIERRRTNRMRALKRAFANPLEIHLPAWDPDRFFGRIVNPLGFMFSGKALVVYALLIAVAISITSTRADEFALSFGELWVIQGKALLGIVTLWLILFFTVVLHEVGHGLTCKKFGGSVHKIGFLFLYFNPCLYCDVTESYFFEDKRKKHAVTLAGGIVDLLTASIATFIWFLTSPDLFLNEVAHRVALFNGVSGILVNFNPLMKYDGYFLLSDHLEIPDLRGESFRFLGNRVRRIFGLPHEEGAVSRRERRIFWTYGILAVLYSLFVLWFVLFFVGGWLVAHLRGTGYLVTAGLVLLMTKRYIKGLAGFARFFAIDKAGHFRRHRLIYGGGAVALVAAFLFLPVDRHVRAPFVFAPGEEIVLRAAESGVIEEVLADEGDLVRAGFAPVVLRSEEIELERSHARTLLAAAEVGRAAAQVARDPGEVVVQAAEVDAGEARRRYVDARAHRLAPATPRDGIVLTRHLVETIGRSCVAGDTLCVIGDISSLKAETLVDEQDLGIIEIDAPVEIRTRADPGRLLSGRVERVSPEPSGGDVRRLYRVLVRVDNSGGKRFPGMTGIARFDAGAVPPVRHLTDKLARILRIEFWI